MKRVIQAAKSLRCRKGHDFRVIDLDRERRGVFKTGYLETRCVRCGYVARRWQEW